jgi:hypothetical protein
LGNDSYPTNYSDVWGYGHANGKGEVDHYSYTINEMNSLLTATYNWKINDKLVLDAVLGNEFVVTTENLRKLTEKISISRDGTTSTMLLFTRLQNHIVKKERSVYLGT